MANFSEDDLKGAFDLYHRLLFKSDLHMPNTWEEIGVESVAIESKEGCPSGFPGKAYWCVELKIKRA